MAGGKGRGAKKFHMGKVAKPKTGPSDKDLNRASKPGREQQGLGSAGRPGGTKSSGGKKVPSRITRMGPSARGQRGR